ncbi:MAG: hypothetical protein RLZZ65_1159 [Bacteroidota bacterium]|jgi:hypothetical protein
MLPKEVRKAWNEAFWSGFKDSMRGKMSSNGRRVNWASYPTQVKNTYLRMICEGQHVSLCFDIQFKDAGIQAIIWEQLTELKVVLENEMPSTTHWEEHFVNKEGLTIGRISWQQEGLNYYQKEDWPAIYSFFQQHLLAFDVFYQEFNEILITLVN